MPWQLYPHFCFSATTWGNTRCFCIGLIVPPTILQSDRSMVVGHVQTVHTCSFMCNNHIDIIAHTLAFLRVGEHSCHPDFHHARRGWLALWGFFQNFLTKTFPWSDSNPVPSIQQVSTLTIKPRRTAQNHERYCKCAEKLSVN